MPRLAPGVRLKFDTARGCWVLLAPERVVLPDETALEVLRRCDGKTPLGTVIDQLAADYDAERDTIAADVQALLGDLGEKGLLQP